MDFDTAKQRKFDAGRAAHPNSDWSTKMVAARREAQEELCDVYWVCGFVAREVLKMRIQLRCRDIWQELEDMGA